MVVFNATDIIQHTFWKYMDPHHSQYDADEAARYGNVILNVYQNIDEKIGHIMESLDEKTTLIIMSDHGAGPLKKAVYLNKWLELQNLLRFSLKGNGAPVPSNLLKNLLGICKRNLPRSTKKSLPGFFLK
jgi:predicted AlkP superfamily phosphohydrolase/phosphomutase